MSDEEIEGPPGGTGRLGAAPGDATRKAFDRGDLKRSIDFVDRRTPEVEEMNHHPDLEVSWERVTMTITTQSEGRLTENDFELARRIERVG